MQRNGSCSRYLVSGFHLAAAIPRCASLTIAAKRPYKRCIYVDISSTNRACRMETRIGKWGNSLALRIPQSVAAQTGITLNATVELTPRGEQLVVSVLKRPGEALDDLLSGVTEDNLHAEIETGPPVGGEAW